MPISKQERWRRKYRDLADAAWGRDGEIEIDDNAQISILPEQSDRRRRGAYVAAWVWVYNPAYAEKKYDNEED